MYSFLLVKNKLKNKGKFNSMPFHVALFYARVSGSVLASGLNV